MHVYNNALEGVFIIDNGDINHIQKFIKADHNIPPPDFRDDHVIWTHPIASEFVNYIKDNIKSSPCQESHYSQK